MGVYDRWHKSRPEPNERRCKEHKLVPSKEHGKGHRWQVQWDEYDANGNRTRPKRNFPLKVGNDPAIHAEAFDTKIKHELLTRSKLPATNAGMDLTDLSRLWIRAMASSPETILRIEEILNKWVIPTIGDVPLPQFPDYIPRVQGWIQHLQSEGLKTSTVLKYREYLSQMLTFGMRRNLVAVNPFVDKLINLPSPDKTLITPYTPDEVTAIRTNLPCEISFMVDLGIGAGCRIGEMCGLSDSDIKGDELFIMRQVKRVRGGLVFKLPKHGKQRSVPLADSVKRALKDLPTTPVTLPWERLSGRETTINVFLTAPRGGPCAHNTYRLAWINALAKAGITRVPHDDLFHKLRHTFASRMLRGGLDIRALSIYMGHDDPAFTLRWYGHFLPGADGTLRRIVDGFS